MKPILMNTEMVRAILDGRKTETRRVCKPGVVGAIEHGQPVGGQPFYKGEILYVRETWSTRPSNHCHAQPRHGGKCPYSSCDSAEGPCFPDEYIYKASDDLPEYGGKWRPSIHMPKEAARLFLRVTDLRAERLQDMTDDEIANEGVIPSIMLTGERINGKVLTVGLHVAWQELWDSTIKTADRDRYGWAANPWVWVICFERCEKPEEA